MILFLEAETRAQRGVAACLKATSYGERSVWDLNPGKLSCRPLRGTSASPAFLSFAGHGRPLLWRPVSWLRMAVWSRACRALFQCPLPPVSSQLPWASGAGSTWVKGQGTETVLTFPWRNRDGLHLAGQVEDTVGFVTLLPVKQL